MLRIYEFDREMNTTYQVDLFLPGSNTSSTSSGTSSGRNSGANALWVHVSVFNPNPHPVDAYW